MAYPGEPQRDLVAECGTTCPTCGGPWRAAVKVCRKCGKAVGRSERWRMVPAGPGLFAIEHRDPCGVVGDGGRMQQLRTEPGVCPACRGTKMMDGGGGSRIPCDLCDDRAGQRPAQPDSVVP